MAQHHHADHTASGGDPTFKARKRSTSEVVRRVWVYVRPYYRLAFATIACAILSLIFALIYPKLTQVIIDEIIESPDQETTKIAWSKVLVRTHRRSERRLQQGKTKKT